jgi:hypothetical protein
MLVYGEDTGRRTRILCKLLELSAVLGVSPGELAIAWQRQMHHRSSSTLVTIAGPRTVNQLDDYLRGVELELRAENVEGLNEVSAPTLGVPFDSIGGPTDVGDDPELSGIALCQSIESFPSSYQRFIRICLVDNDFRGTERKMVDKDPPIQLPSIPLTPATNSSSKTTEFAYGPSVEGRPFSTTRISMTT